ncbi:Rhophilin-2 [Orchesella cincta]|uniref:Rhophilin-2 n=1 Tax=Orchesella cincta TaxID=48709 RepID=A0A1D2NK07_ORCCI|nr:Rhophilin-2 [Orchesella cincta]
MLGWETPLSNRNICNNGWAVWGNDPCRATCRGSLQTRRSQLNREIHREMRLRAGAENLLKATSNRTVKETATLELSFVNSHLQLLREQLAEINGCLEAYQGQG